MNALKLFFTALPLGSIKQYALIGLIIYSVVITLLWRLEISSHKLTASEFDAFKRELQVQRENNEVRLALQAKLANQNIVKIIQSHQEEVERIKHDYNISQKSNVSTIGNLRNSLRQALSSRDALPQIASDTERTPEEWGNSYATITRNYKELETACKITTLDYNALRDYADGNCLVYGCE